jgi:hypothetical protein
VATIASLIVDVAANTATLNKNVTEIQSQLDRVSGYAKTAAVALAGVFTIQAIESAAMKVVDYGGRITDLSTRLGVSTKVVQEWEGVFGKAGVEIDTVAKASGELANRLVGGDKSAVGALEKMGISVQTLKSLSPEQQFNLVADAVGNLQNKSEQIYASKTLFGKGGVELLAALDGHLQENIKSFDALGGVIDDKTLKAADDFGDELGLMGKQLLAVTAAIVVPLLPAVAKLGELLIWLGQNALGPMLVTVIENCTAAFNVLWIGLTKFISGLIGLAQHIPIVGKYLTGLGDAQKWLDEQSAKSVERLKDWAHGTNQAGEAAGKAAPKLLGLGKDGTEGAKGITTLGDALKRQQEEAKQAQEAQDKWNASIEKATIAANLSTFSLNKYGAIALPAVTSALGDAIDATRDWVAPLQDATGEVEDLQRAGRFMAAEIVKAHDAIATLPNVIPAATEAIKDATEASYDFGAAFQGALSSVSTILDNISGKFAEVTSIAARTISSVVANLASGNVIGAVTAGITGVVGAFKKLFHDAEKDVNPVRQAFIDAAGGLGVLNQRAHTAGITLDHLLDARNPKAYKAAIDELNAAFDFQDKAAKTLDDTVQKYGFTIDQLGPALQRQELDKQFATLFQDYNVLHAAGIDQVAITQQMSDSVSKYVQQSIAMGLEIPAAMRPMLENFAKNGDLIDANGNQITDLAGAGITFAETMTQSVDRVVKSVQMLVDAITRQLNPAIQNIPDGSFTVHGQVVVDGGGLNVPDIPDPLPQAVGGSYFVTKPTLFLAGEAGPEYADFSGANKSRGSGGDGSFGGGEVEHKLDQLLAAFRGMPQLLAIQIAGAVAQQSGRR